MARISSPFHLAGTYGHLVVYKVGSKLYARTRSRLTGQRFRKDPAFVKSREKAVQFGEASKLAKTIYATLPKALKQKGLFGKLTGLVHKGLQEGKTKECIIKEVRIYFGMPVLIEPSKPVKIPARHLPLLSIWQVTAEGKLQDNSITYKQYHMLRSIRGA